MNYLKTVCGAIGAVCLILGGSFAVGESIDGKDVAGSLFWAFVGGSLIHVYMSKPKDSNRASE